MLNFLAAWWYIYIKFAYQLEVVSAILSAQVLPGGLQC